MEKSETQSDNKQEKNETKEKVSKIESKTNPNNFSEIWWRNKTQVKLKK